MTDTNKTLSFAKGNAKLDGDTFILSLPAGHTCLGANLCRSSVNRETGKITDGPNTEFRCFATLPENLFKTVRESRWNNFDLLKQANTAIGMANLIESSLLTKKNVKRIRIHGSGDFFNQAYFDAWIMVAQQHPDWIFYGYSKMLPLWVKRLNVIPSNLKLVASRGGKFDDLIDMMGLRFAKVVFSEDEAKQLGLEIDHDDSLLWKGDKDFCLLIHGTMPAGSAAGKAVYKLRKQGKGGYKADYFHHGKGKKTVTVPAVVTINTKAGKITMHPAPLKLSNKFKTIEYVK